MSSPAAATAIALMPNVATMSLSSGQALTFKETFMWPGRIRADMEVANKVLNGEKMKLIEELDWRCDNFRKSLQEIAAGVQKVRYVERKQGRACLSSCAGVVA